MSEFKVIETQEELDKIISTRLKKEKEKFQNQIDELTTERDNLKVQIGEKDKALEKGKTGSEGLNNKIKELEGKLSNYEISKLKTSIALQNGIPYDLADRLTGSNEEELTNDAIKLAEYIGQKTPIAPLKSSEPKGSNYEGRNKALLDMANNLTNRGE